MCDAFIRISLSFLHFSFYTLVCCIFGVHTTTGVAVSRLMDDENHTVAGCLRRYGVEQVSKREWLV